MFQKNKPREQTSIVRMALKALANICVQNNENRFKTFWRFADAYSQKWNINQFINTNTLSGFPSKEMKNTSILCIASEFADSSFVIKLLSKGANVNMRDDNGNTCLHLAAQSQNQSAEKIAVLLDHDPSLISTFNRYGYYPIHSAVLAKNYVGLSALICSERLNVNETHTKTARTVLQPCSNKWMYQRNANTSLQKRYQCECTRL